MGRTDMEVSTSVAANKSGQKWLVMERIFKLEK
jgi:hypothetical protein